MEKNISLQAVGPHSVALIPTKELNISVPVLVGLEH